MSVPVRTPEQRTAALARAQEVRRERADLRAALKDGSADARALVAAAESDERWHALKVAWLLQSLPGIGPARAEALMAACAIAGDRRLGGLSDRQRRALVQALDGGRA